MDSGFVKKQTIQGQGAVIRVQHLIRKYSYVLTEFEYKPV